jgi:large subunit ribosomal protein L13
VIEHAVKGMLPHNRLGNSMMKKLKVYVGDTHPHLGQIKASSTRVEEEL